MVQALLEAQGRWDIKREPPPFVPQLVVYNQPDELSTTYAKDPEPVQDVATPVVEPSEGLEAATLPEGLAVPESVLEALPDSQDEVVPVIDTRQEPSREEHRLRADAKITKEQAEAVQHKRKQQQVMERVENE